MTDLQPGEEDVDGSDAELRRRHHQREGEGVQNLLLLFFNQLLCRVCIWVGWGRHKGWGIFFLKNLFSVIR